MYNKSYFLELLVELIGVNFIYRFVCNILYCLNWKICLLISVIFFYLYYVNSEFLRMIILIIKLVY